jgi:hypothetical protein
MVLKVLREYKEQVVLMAHRERRVLQEPVAKGHKVYRGFRVSRVYRDFRELLVQVN